MDYLSEIMEIIEGGLQNNPTKVSNYTSLLIKKLEDARDGQSASRIKKLLSSKKMLAMSAKSLITKEIPVDSESRIPLAEVMPPEDPEVSFIFLQPAIREQIEEYINVLKKEDQLAKYDVNAYKNLLLFGPPGTGKSKTAKYIASQVGLPLVTVRIDGLISSYLGSTSKNMKTLFDYVERTPCILFLDEFDAFAKMRDDTNELGELKRVVNTLLQNLDSIWGKKSIIAATNHEHLLDPAVWRRFDYKIKLDLPEKEQRKQMITRFLGKEMADLDLDTFIELTDKMSGAEIENVCNSLKTSTALSNKSKITPRDIFLAFIRTQLTSSEVFAEDREVHYAKKLRSSKPQIFNYRALSEMLGKPLATTYRLLRDDENG